jgi:hypothetical protein
MLQVNVMTGKMAQFYESLSVNSISQKTAQALKQGFTVERLVNNKAIYTKQGDYGMVCSQ